MRRQVERCVLRARSEASALLRHVALDVGEDGLELGLVADGREVLVVISGQPPKRPRSVPTCPHSGLPRQQRLALLAAQGVDVDVSDAKPVGAQPRHVLNCCLAERQQASRACIVAAHLENQRQIDRSRHVAGIHRGDGLEQFRVGSGITGPRLRVLALPQIVITQNLEHLWAFGRHFERVLGVLDRECRATCKQSDLA